MKETDMPLHFSAALGRWPLAWLLLPLFTVLTACAIPAGPTALPARSLVGTEWRLENLAGGGVLDRAQATLVFPEPGRVAGSGSCNRFFGSVTLEQDRIGFGQMGATRMTCIGAVGDQENRYLAALQQAERFEVRGTTLLIHARGMDQLLRFIRTKP
jgi:heat shock protein HslJ